MDTSATHSLQQPHSRRLFGTARTAFRQLADEGPLLTSPTLAALVSALTRTRDEKVPPRLFDMEKFGTITHFGGGKETTSQPQGGYEHQVHTSPRCLNSEEYITVYQMNQ